MNRAVSTRLVLYALDAGLQALLGLVLLMLAARSGDVATFGVFALTLAVTGIQVPLSVLGVGGLLYGRAASRPLAANRLYWPGLAITLVSGPAMYGLTVVALGLFASPLLTGLYALAGLRVLAAVGEPLRAILQARSRPGDYVPIRGVTASAALAGAGLAFVAGADIVWYAAIWGLEWLAFAGVLLVVSLRRGVCPPVRRPRVRPILMKAAPLLVHAVCIVIYMRFDQLYVAWRFGEADLGVYAAAARIAEAGNIAYGIIGLVVSPRIIREWRGGGLSTPSRLVLALIGAGSVGAAMVCWVWGDVLLRVVFGPAFAAGTTILAVYVLSTCFGVYGSIGSRLNIAQGQSNPSMISGLIGAISNVALTVLFCELQGPLGAATATVVSYALAAAVLWLSIVQHHTMLVKA